VAYAVPAAAAVVTDSVKQIYDSLANRTYTNFTQNLRQISCNVTGNSASYSLVRNCDDCSAAYKDWICAVTIPRCTDISASSGVDRFVNGSRNVFTKQVTQTLQAGSYKEVLPCIDLCYKVVQSCPAVLQFGCPLKKTLSNSYGERLPNGSVINGTEITCNPMDLDWTVNSGANNLIWRWITSLTITMTVGLLHIRL
jgi:calcium channel MID1